MSYAAVELAVDLNALARELERKIEQAKRRWRFGEARALARELADVRAKIAELAERN